MCVSWCQRCAWGQAHCCLLEIIKPNSGFKIQPHKLTDGDWRHTFYTFVCVCVCEIRILPTSHTSECVCSDMVLRSVCSAGWLALLGKGYFSPFSFLRLAAPFYLQTPWSQNNKIPWPPGKRQCPLTPVAT